MNLRDLPGKINAAKSTADTYELIDVSRELLGKTLHAASTSRYEHQLKAAVQQAFVLDTKASEHMDDGCISAGLAYAKRLATLALQTVVKLYSSDFERARWDDQVFLYLTPTQYIVWIEREAEREIDWVPVEPGKIVPLPEKQALPYAPSRDLHRLAARLYARTEKRGQCLVWTGKACNGAGYFFPVKGVTKRAQVVAWELKYGPVDDPRRVYARCGNKLCLEHLALREQSEENEVAA